MRSRRVALLLITVASADLVLAACGDDEGVSLASVEPRTVTEVVEAPATVSARASAIVSAPAGGRVLEILVVDGSPVQQGQPLVRVDSPDAQARLAQARAALAAVSRTPTVPRVDVSGMQAQVDEAADAAFEASREAAASIEDATAREVALASIARTEARYAAARAQAQAAVDGVNAGLSSLSSSLRAITAAQRLQAQVAVDVAQGTVDALLVRAPITGTVQLTASSTGGSGGGGLGSLLSQLPSDVAAAASSALGSSASSGSGGSGSVPTDMTLRVGAPVAAGSTLALVVDASALGLVAEVDETDVFMVRPGIGATVQVDAAPGATYPATVTAVDLAPTTSSQGGVSYRVMLDLGAGTMPTGTGTAGADEQAPAPRPGMSAVARLAVRTAQDVVAVPVSAVVRDEGQDVVWVSVGGKAERRGVTLGAQGEDFVEVTEGLEQGESVVVAGADRVAEGQDLP